MLLLDIIHSFFSLLENLQNRTNIFEESERKLSQICKLFERQLLCSCIFYYLSPPALQFRAYITDTVTERTYEAPYHDLYYFFDATKSPWFEVCYILNGISIVPIFIIFLCIDFLFVSVSWYIVAMYNELQSILKELKVTRFEKVNLRRNVLCQSLQFHTDILRYFLNIEISRNLIIFFPLFRFIEAGNKIFNEIIFVQFAYSLLTLVTLVFISNYVTAHIDKMGKIIKSHFFFLG